jgi:hypothetical protein
MLEFQNQQIRGLQRLPRFLSICSAQAVDKIPSRKPCQPLPQCMVPHQDVLVQSVIVDHTGRGQTHLPCVHPTGTEVQSVSNGPGKNWRLERRHFWNVLRELHVIEPDVSRIEQPTASLPRVLMLSSTRGSEAAPHGAGWNGG